MGTYTYTTDGGTLTHTGTVGSPLQYGGGYADSETALIYLQARYYDPATGQFLTVDAALTATAAPYGYVNGNYTNLIDPLGLWGWNPADWTAGNWATVGLVAGGIALAATGVGVAVDLEVIGDFAAADLVGGIGYGAGALATATDAVPCGRSALSATERLDGGACVGAALGLVSLGLGGPGIFGSISRSVQGALDLGSYVAGGVGLGWDSAAYFAPGESLAEEHTRAFAGGGGPFGSGSTNGWDC